MYFQWMAKVFLMLFVWALTYPLALVLPLFAKDTYGPMCNNTTMGIGPRLPDWLSWFQTPDNDLNGDFGWIYEHWQWRYQLPKNIRYYVGMVGWLWRNPACGVGNIKVGLQSLSQCNVLGSLHISDNPLVPGYTLITSPEFFHFRVIAKVPGVNLAFSCNYGWNVTGYVKDITNEFGNDTFKRKTATLAFSPIRLHRLL